MELRYYITLFILLFWSTPTLQRTTRNRHFPPQYARTFIRDSVERIPTLEGILSKMHKLQEFGSQSLPLREAVEQIPDLIENSVRLPLRDAVEKRPAPDDPAENIEKIDYNYFSPNFHNPPRQTLYTPLQYFRRIVGLYQPYRVDNEYQQLLGYFRPGGRSYKYQKKIPEEPRIVCYIQAAAVYRQQPLTFIPDDLDPHVCSHVIYAFATIDPHSFHVISHDEEFDIIQGGYRSVTGLKRTNPDLKVLISVGESREDSSRRFSSMVSSAKRRGDFIRSLVRFVELYDFDGVDLHWQYPGSPEFGGDSSDKQHFTLLLEEISYIFLERDWILSVAVPTSRFRIEDGFEPEKLAEFVNFLNVEAYDLHRDREPVAEHHSNLNSAEYAVQYWLNQGIPSSKIVLGIPFFGRSFTLQFPNDTAAGAPIQGPGREGFYTQTPGFLAYFEICDMLLNEGWERMVDQSGSPFMVYGDQWVGYDDAESIQDKISYVKEMQLGGVFVWSADLDDFKGLCGEQTPLLKTIQRNLQLTPPNQEEEYYQNIKTLDIFDDRALSEETSSPKVVCYVTNWSFYRKADGKFVPEHIDQRLCTHVVYAFASLDPQKLILREFDPWADFDNDLYERVTSLQDTKVLLSLGGWTDSAGDKYSRLVSDGSARRKFVLGVISFLRKHNFKGLHFDWNYPVCWQSNCRKGPASDKPNFTKLLQELRKEFDRQTPRLVLAAAISGYKEVIDVAYDLPGLSNILDFISVMTYDYHGAWERQTGHVSPLYGRPGDKYPQYNTNFTMEYLVSKGASRSKLLVGVPFYGQSFTLAKTSSYALEVPSAGPGEPGEYTKQPGMLAYYEICHRVRNQRWIVAKDNAGASGPHAYFREQWVGFEDVNSVKTKAEYIKNQGFGGAVAWTIDLDDFGNRCCGGSYPLLKSLNYGLGLITEPPKEDCTKPVPPVTPVPPQTTTGIDSGAKPTTEHEHHHEEWTEKPSTWWSEPSSTTRRPTVVTWWPQESTTTRRTTTTTAKPSTWWSVPFSTTIKPTVVTWWPQETTTTRRTTTKTTTTTSKPSTITSKPPISTAIPSPAVVMPEPDNNKPSKSCHPGQYLPDEKNCNAYYRCILGELRKQYCAGGLHWNRDRSICDWPSEAKCERTSQKPSRTTTQRVIVTEASEYEEKCNTGQYYPHEQCNSFYICVNEKLVPQSCAPGLFWNAEEAMCDWVHKVRCYGRKELAERLTHHKKTGLQPQPYSSCAENIFAPYPNDCTRYLHCLWGKYDVASCAPGLHWNNERQICDWPENANCDSTSIVNINDILTETPPEPSTSRPEWKPPTGTTGYPEWSPPSTSKPSSTTGYPEWKPEEWHPPIPPTSEQPPLSEPLKPHSGYFKIVCYFTNWAWYRQGAGRYLPEDIDPNLCTHIVYGFAVLDFEGLIVKAHDSWADFDNQFYKRVTELKAKGVKVSLAIGGWNDSQGDKYSRLVNNPTARARFIKHVLEFLEKWNFDGLDLDWEYPKCWQVDCKKGPDSDKAAFAAWVRELKQAFRPKGYLLSAAVSPSKTVIDAGYEVPVLAENLDWVAVMTYDFHGQWDKQTGHVAPMYYHPEDAVAFYNTNFSINYWISEGVPRRKIVMGMPLYGQSFRLENEANNRLNAKAPGPGEAGEFTRAAGFLAYYEICYNIKNQGWTVVQDPEKRMGPYAYRGNQWVSFDDRDMIRSKSEYIRKMDLGGGMIWALDLDDFKNRCGEGRHPLLTTIRNVLADDGTGIPEHPEPQEPEPVEAESEVPALPPRIDPPVIPPSTSPAPFNPNSEYKVVCYFTNWAWYRQGVGKYLPSNIDPDLCTHIVYGFAVLNNDQLIIKPHDTWADFDNKFYDQVTAFKAKGIKVLIAIGGWNDSAGDKYSKLVNNPSARRRFVAHVADFIETNNFDGLDLDWEYPRCWQVDCNKGPDSDKAGFAALVRELSETFKPRGWLLSAAVSPSKKVIDAGYDVEVLSQNLDWIAVMCYDYHGQWDKQTGHVAPMYGHPEDADPTFNTNFTINYWIELGADRKKLVLGMPMYGQSFSLADNKENGLNAATYGGGEAGEETRARGFLAYYEICTNIREKSWNVVQDRKGRIGPYAYLRDQWVSFDDTSMIRHKSEYIKAMGLGGGMIWALDLDDFKNLCGCEEYPLLRTINRVLRGYSKPDPKCVLGTIPSIETSTAVIPQEVPEMPPVPCQGRVFLPDNIHCNQYYLCNQGELQLQVCPSGLFWNKDHCDWPENTQCHPDSTPRPQTEEKPLVIPENPLVVPENPLITKPTSTVTRPESGYKVICYFTNWAWYRQGDGKYLPEDIDPSLCTHINYGFAVLDPNTLTLKPHDSWADIDNEFYTNVVRYKKQGVRVLIALGGWNDSLGDKYSRLVNDPEARARFIANVLEFIEQWDFDGLDLDWEYPKCWQVDCNKGPDSDKAGFAALVRELSQAFKLRGLLLSAAVSPSKAVIDAGYDVPVLSRYFDWIAVMTYDFHGHWDKATGHVAPLFYYPGDTWDYFNANFSLNYWIEKGASPEKLIMGLPLYGQSFTLADNSNRGLNAKSYGPGEAGEFTRAGGFLAFYEICERVKKQGWTVTRDPEGRIGPYAYKNNQWVSYDDTHEVKRKADLVKKLGLGGGMVWALDLDDFRNRCGCGKHPLLKTLNQELRGTSTDLLENCT